jgi:trehalose 6-phosphate synthase/phosphatase
MSRLFIVSNRLPVTISISDGNVTARPSVGGLATGLAGPHKRSGGLWIGWPGDISEITATQKVQLEQSLEKINTVPIYISREELEEFYASFANGVLWPLFHYLVDRLPYEPHGWEAYRKINQRFADEVCDRYRLGDLIWVHDYQLALVPQMIRNRLPEAIIGYFLHIPFPAAEVFRLLPWREEILRGILGADIVGFHTFSYVRQFLNTVIYTLGLIPSVDYLTVERRRVKLWAYPMGIDSISFDTIAQTPEVKEEVTNYRRELGEQSLLLGVDRLDYTKGIPRRLLAIERLLETQPSFRGKIRFVQVAAPSRRDVQQYEVFTNEVQQLVGRINGRFTTRESVPVHFFHRGFNQRDLVSLYSSADIMLVTALRDGMNLVAKEFVASRNDEDGVLVLSEFAGAASEMGEAVLVNPYDIDGTAQAIYYALEMRPKERRTRMLALRERVFRHDVHRWADAFIRELSERGQVRSDSIYPQSPRTLGPDVIAKLHKANPVIWLLDYDGTLVPFAQRPEFAEPDDEIIDLLKTLAVQPNTHVHLLSGCRRDMLQEWLGELSIGLHAENGFWSRDHAGEWQANASLGEDASWLDRVRMVLDEFTRRTPGSFIEEKTASLAWHYRMADVEYGEWQARELKIYLAHAFSNVAVEVLPGHKVIEIKPYGVHNGIVVQGLLADMPDAQIIAIGDDETDSHLFRSLPQSAVSICVGSPAKESAARYRLSDVTAVRKFLHFVVETLEHDSVYRAS